MSAASTHQVPFGSDFQPEGHVVLADGLDERPVGVAHADLSAPLPVVGVQPIRRSVVDDLEVIHTVLVPFWEQLRCSLSWLGKVHLENNSVTSFTS